MSVVPYGAGRRCSTLLLLDGRASALPRYPRPIQMPAYSFPEGGPGTDLSVPMLPGVDAWTFSDTVQVLRWWPESPHDSVGLCPS